MHGWISDPKQQKMLELRSDARKSRPNAWHQSGFRSEEQQHHGRYPSEFLSRTTSLSAPLNLATTPSLRTRRGRKEFAERYVHISCVTTVRRRVAASEPPIRPFVVRASTSVGTMLHVCALFITRHVTTDLLSTLDEPT
jgi:hypothetical protein